MSKAEKPIPIVGRVTGVSEADAARLSVVALRGGAVLASAGLRPDGAYRLNLPHHAAHADSPYALQLSVLPTTAAAHPAKVGGAPVVKLDRESVRGPHPIEGPQLALTAAQIDAWSIFWREWCVSGAVVGPDGCPAPASDVTVYTVSWGSGGYTKTSAGQRHHRAGRDLHPLLPLVGPAVSLLAMRAGLVGLLAVVVGV